NLLSHHEKAVNTIENYDLRIFNSYENSVRSLMNDHPFDRKGIEKDSPKFIQIILIGFGDIGKRVILHAAQTCHFANQKKPAIIVYDTNIALEQNRFLTNNPAIKDICDIQWKPFDFDNIKLEKEISTYLQIESAITTILFVFDDPVKNILKASEICQVVGEDTQVLVRMHDESRMAEALESRKGDFFANQIKVFGLPKQTSSFELIIEEELDKMARAIHEYYLDKFPPQGAPRPSQLPWNQLSQEYKDANRQAANHIPVKLRAVNCEFVSEKDKRPQAEFPSDEIEMMAIMEHNRWCAERRLKGWTYAPVRDDLKKQNDCLIPWEKLPDKEKKKDREQVRNLHDILSRIGLKIIRRTD
ncbi:hypothetical protein GF337_11730, partial [candidate division KSB1 bacterium]|nr:hypothetical protein [candidate division KSB1 bacterium]